MIMIEVVERRIGFMLTILSEIDVARSIKVAYFNFLVNYLINVDFIWLFNWCNMKIPQKSIKKMQISLYISFVIV